MDRILISDLLVRCIIGVRDEERREKQDVLINISLFADLRKAGKSDHIGDTTDYSSLKKQIIKTAENSHFFTIEALAESLAEICLTSPAVSEVLMRVEKPSALRFARSVGVEIIRKRRKWSWSARS
jgi:FolB domain-containing protein